MNTINNRLRFLHRLCSSLSSVLQISQSKIVPFILISRQQNFINFFTGYERRFSSTSILKSEIINNGRRVNEEFLMNYEELLKAQQDNRVLIIDVREKSEIEKTGILPGSIHIPMGQVIDELTNSTEESFRNKYKKELPSKDTKIVFSCAIGKRSGLVQEQFQKFGYKNVYNYKGGWTEWESKTKNGN